MSGTISATYEYYFGGSFSDGVFRPDPFFEVLGPFTLDDFDGDNNGSVAPGGTVRSDTEGNGTYRGLSDYGPVIEFGGSYLLFTDDRSVVDDFEIPVNTSATYSFCFYAGTLIATPAGEVAVEDLQPGDLVCTADGRVLPVRWMGQQHVHSLFADPMRSLPVRIAAGALGDGLPRRDLLVSPSHAMGLGRLIAQAAALVNGTSIRREPRSALPTQFTWYHIELAEHALVLAEGAPAESFVDNASPEHFHNAAQRTQLLGDNVPPIEEMDLPRVISARQLPPAERARLDAIAQELGFTATQAA